MHFKQIGIMASRASPEVLETVEHVAILLNSLGVSVYVEAALESAFERGRVTFLPLDAFSKKIDLLIAVGGDGNLLHAARTMSLAKVPVVGINRGQLGYLTDLAPHELEKALLPILQGDYVSEERFLLEGEVVRAGGEHYGLGNALNDIVLFPGEVAQLIEFEMRIDGQFVYSQRSDGLIISTPTGSTAYALSAGGPIIAPHLALIILVPKLPHTLTSRPVVIDANSQIEICLANYNKTAARLSYDGQTHLSLHVSDRILIRRQALPLVLLHPKTYDYYAIWREKLHWGEQLIAL